MNLLTLADVGQGRLQLSWRCGDEPPLQCPQPVSVSDPLTDADRAELRWYLEEYLDLPYGAYKWQAQRVEDRMAEWGRGLFEQVFAADGPDPTPRALYEEAARVGLEQCELSLSLEAPALLSLPWELLRDPAPGRGYLALLLGGLYRCRGLRAEAAGDSAPAAPFRILLVVARPRGRDDVPLGTVARPLLEALRPLRPRIEVELLRPPTFAALEGRLNDRRGYFHLVHFDGHGVFARPQAGRGSGRQFSVQAGSGHLVFEKEDGTPDIVNSQDLGQALAACRVPLFVLNACQSAAGWDPFASVASQLVATGARGVVAMAYTVYAVAASRFMGRFYERLTEHASLAEAVAAARRALFSQPLRESVAGDLELRDWMVPTLYQQEAGYVPIPQGAAAAVAEGPPAGGDIVQRRPVAELCPPGAHGFIGRDHDILRLERALRDDDSPWALVSGVGGVGKTELAYGFARWFAETGGCPGGVFVASFRHQAGFGQVIGSIVGHATEFSRLLPQQQFDWLVDHLSRNPCLLVWDNFEPVAGYPPGGPPLGTDEERARLARFLQDLRGGKTRVVITTRKPDEAWLGVAYQLVEVGGLVPQDAAGLARSILKTVGRRLEEFRDDPEYARLLRLLLGHPRSLEVVLPHLRRRSPSNIVQALQHRLGPLGNVLDESLSYVFTLLSERAQRHLPFLGLFAARVHLDHLRVFVCAGDKQEEAYREVMGESLDAGGWEAVLEEAASVGLVRHLGGGLYELHPTFPAFLRQRLEAAVGAAGLERLEAEFLRFYASLAAFLLEAVTGGDTKATLAVAVEEANLLRALDLARADQGWEPAQAIVRTLGQFYADRGRRPELDALRAGLLEWVGREMPAGADRLRAGLWMYLLGNEAIAALGRSDLAAAEDAYQRILRYLAPLQDPASEPSAAFCYHHLGIIAEERQRFDQAEEWYRRALEVRERLGLERDAATDYHQLGRIAQERQQFDQAEQWYRRALGTFERLGLERDAATDYHQLGMIAQERQRFDQAEEWYRRALEVRERLGLEREAAFDYHQLGNVAYFQQQFDQAEQWYRRALGTFERLGLERDAAHDYHQLGIIAQERQQFDQAEQWYRRALAVFERLGLERDAASDYYQLGIIAQLREQFDQAEEWYRRALEVFERLGLERDAAHGYHQLGVIAQLRKQFDQAEQWYQRALEVLERLGHPRLRVRTLAILGKLRLQQNRLREAVAWYGRALAIATEYRMGMAGHILGLLADAAQAMGDQEFRAAWQEAFPGQEPPLKAGQPTTGHAGPARPTPGPIGPDKPNK